MLDKFSTRYCRIYVILIMDENNPPGKIRDIVSIREDNVIAKR